MKVILFRYSVVLLLLIANGLGQELSAELEFTSHDIGDVGISGGAEFDANTEVYTVHGAGSGMGGTSDSFQFLSKSETGNFDIIAKIVNLENSNPLAQAGIMIRESLDSHSTFVMTALSGDRNLYFQHRSSMGGASFSASGSFPAIPVWLRLTRTASSFTSYVFVDSYGWIKTATVNIAMTPSVFVGLMVTSRNVSVLAQATLDQVKVRVFPDPPPPWENRDIGNATVPGFSAASNGVYWIQSSGPVIGAQADEFHFVYQSLLNDGEISARIIPSLDPSSGGRIGLMIRESLTSDAPSVYFSFNFIQNQGRFAFQNREATGGDTVGFLAGVETAPVWFKLHRSGQLYTASQSHDGSNWAQVGPVLTNSMTTNLFIGIAGASLWVNRRGEAFLDQFKVVGGGQPPPPTDSDGDGLLDAWEINFFGNLDQDAEGDFDGDGLTNLEELQRGTHPTLSDTDHDGVADKIEILQGRSPLKGAVADIARVVNLDLFTPLE
jgi:hypothetical protein